MTQYQRDGKGLYYGESSRSLYERSKEHIKDREDGEDDSHQVKHWKIDHNDMEEPPAFKFKMIQSFQDPLTRQLAESVRIEAGGTQILNSKSEYSRCRVPRLKVILEEWKPSAMKEDRKVEDLSQDDMAGQLDALEKHSRRKDNKRKPEDDPMVPNPKRRRFPKLMNWGEVVEGMEKDPHPSIQDWLEKDDTKEIETAKDDTSEESIENETERMLSRKRKLQKDGKDDDIFKFKKKGKLTKNEIVEIKKTHINIMDWVRKERVKLAEKESFEKEIEDEPMEMESEPERLEREERVCRMKAKKKRFASRRMTKEILEEVMDDVVRHADMEMMKDIMSKVLERVDTETRINRMVQELEQGPPGLEEKLEERLRTRRLEEMLAMRMLILEEEKLERLAEMTRRKELWITNWKKKNMENLMNRMLSLDLEEHGMDWGETYVDGDDMEIVETETEDDDARAVEEENTELEMYIDCEALSAEENQPELCVSDMEISEHTEGAIHVSNMKYDGALQAHPPPCNTQIVKEVSKANSGDR